MKNVKYKLLPVLCLCICMLWGLSITAFALVPDASCTDILKAEFEVGDSAYYYTREEYTTSKGQLYTYVLENTFVISDSNKYMCFYLSEDSRASSGYTLKVYENSVGGSYNKIYVDGEYSRTTTSMSSASNIAPNIYRIDTDRTTTAFHTNIPIFPTLELAEQYSQGLVGVDSAVNYNKTVTDSGWVRPFEDIEINDTDILVPKLSNISHEGFTLINCNDERYVVEIYMRSGFATPEAGLSAITTIDNALYVNNYGLISDNSEAYYNGPTFNVAQLYGIDNNTGLTNSYTSFYSAYPSANSYNENISRDDSYKIWGHPFGRNEWFYTNNTEVVSSDLIGKRPSDFDLCFTNYRVRYFYYDDLSGYHYGPWVDVVYFSSGYVTQSAVFEGNDGNIINTPIVGGEQDSDGNISLEDDTNYIDLNNPNNLFGYIRSVINNVNATMGNFSTLFATVFTFIPADMQAMIWLGLAVMVVIGVIKVIKS